MLNDIIENFRELSRQRHLDEWNDNAARRIVTRADDENGLLTMAMMNEAGTTEEGSSDDGEEQSCVEESRRENEESKEGESNGRPGVWSQLLSFLGCGRQPSAPSRPGSWAANSPCYKNTIETVMGHSDRKIRYWDVAVSSIDTTSRQRVRENEDSGLRRASMFESKIQESRGQVERLVTLFPCSGVLARSKVQSSQNVRPKSASHIRREQDPEAAKRMSVPAL